eukprot:800522-Amphidinium_carterae.1
MVLRVSPPVSSSAPLPSVSPVLDDYFVLEGEFSPSIRASENSTGETTLAVLESCPKPPAELLALFKTCVRHCETDECGSNARAEQLFLLQQEQVPWLHCHFHCLAHKAHACASKTWALQPTTVSSVIHTCKVLQGSGALARVKDAVADILAEKL